jgi:hypothetical protein
VPQRKILPAPGINPTLTAMYMYDPNRWQIGEMANPVLRVIKQKGPGEAALRIVTQNNVAVCYFHIIFSSKGQKTILEVLKPLLEIFHKFFSQHISITFVVFTSVY